jgi:hypothetical protein
MADHDYNNDSADSAESEESSDSGGPSFTKERCPVLPKIDILESHGNGNLKSRNVQVASSGSSPGFWISRLRRAVQDAQSRHHATLLLCCCKSKKNNGHFHEDNASSVLQFGSGIPNHIDRSLVPVLKSSIVNCFIVGSQTEFLWDQLMIKRTMSSCKHLVKGPLYWRVVIRLYACRFATIHSFSGVIGKAAIELRLQKSACLSKCIAW